MNGCSWPPGCDSDVEELYCYNPLEIVKLHERRLPCMSRIIAMSRLNPAGRRD